MSHEIRLFFGGNTKFKIGVINWRSKFNYLLMEGKVKYIYTQMLR